MSGLGRNPEDWFSHVAADRIDNESVAMSVCLGIVLLRNHEL